MKTLHTLAAIVVAGTTLMAGQAMAADAPASAPTRAEVKAEVAKARADGSLTKTPNQDIQAVKPKESARHKKRREAKEAKAAAAASAAAAGK